MPIFKGFFASTRALKADSQVRASEDLDGPETAPVKMDLEERKAFRRELLFEIVRTTLTSQFIDTSSYRFKVMRTDKRGHCYVVMLDMSPKFMATDKGQHAQLVGIAALLSKNAQIRYGLVVDGVYWRVDDTLNSPSASRFRPFDSADRAAGAPGAPGAPGAGSSAGSANIEKYQRATAQELAAFEAAWQKNNAVQIGDRTYSSDLAPLAKDPPEK